MFVDQTDPNVEGVYETQVSPLFRAILQIGCVCRVLRGVNNLSDVFDLDDLDITNVARQPYLPKESLRHIYLYQHKANTGPRQMFGLFLSPLKKAVILVCDSVRTNLMPNMQTLYQTERLLK